MATSTNTVDPVLLNIILDDFILYNEDLFTLMNDTLYYDYRNIKLSVWAHTWNALNYLYSSFSLYTIHDLTIELELAILFHDIGRCFGKGKTPFPLTIQENGDPTENNNYASLMIYDILKKMRYLNTGVNVQKVIELVNQYVKFYNSFNIDAYSTISAQAKQNLMKLFVKDTQLYKDMMLMTKCITYCEPIMNRNMLNAIRQKDMIVESIFEQSRKYAQSDINKEYVLKFIMLIGLPGSGKTTFRNNLLSMDNRYKVLSFDDLIEEECKRKNETYDQVFNEDKNHLIKKFNMNVKKLLNDKENIICDCTNLSIQSRSKKLSQVGNSYYKKAYVFILSLDEIIKRNEERSRKEHKTINQNTLYKMCDRFEVPTYLEFDEIEYIIG